MHLIWFFSPNCTQHLAHFDWVHSLSLIFTSFYSSTSFRLLQSTRLHIINYPLNIQIGLEDHWTLFNPKLCLAANHFLYSSKHFKSVLHFIQRESCSCDATRVLLEWRFWSECVLFIWPTTFLFSRCPRTLTQGGVCEKKSCRSVLTPQGGGSSGTRGGVGKIHDTKPSLTNTHSHKCKSWSTLRVFFFLLIFHTIRVIVVVVWNLPESWKDVGVEHTIHCKGLPVKIRRGNLLFVVSFFGFCLCFLLLPRFGIRMLSLIGVYWI